MNKHIVFDCDGTLVDTSSYKYELYPGIKDLILALSTNCTLYVWTARDRRSTLRILAELEVLLFFEGICTADDSIPKPHISGIQQLVQGVQKSQICVIGDTTNDIIGAKNFGAKSIGALWNTEVNGAILMDSGCDFLASAPSECLEWVNKNIS